MSKLLKICGMRDFGQIKSVIEDIKPDLIGFIFYPKSPRYLGENFKLPSFSGVNTKKTGVFVNETLEKMLQLTNNYDLDYLQLHGNETPETIRELKKQGVKVIKAFRVDNDFDMEAVNVYEGLCDFFLFDANVKGYGGGGVRFDWSVLESYQGDTPWLLSGGLNLKNMPEVQNYNFCNFAGFDVNSGFENSPGDKKLDMLKNIYQEGLLQ